MTIITGGASHLIRHDGSR